MNVALAALAAVLAAGPPGSIDALAGALSGGVAAARPAAPVAVAVSSPAPAVADAVAGVLAARLTASGFPSFVLPAGDDTSARARAQGAETLVTVEVRLDAELWANGQLRSLWRNFWAGRAEIRSPPATALAASVQADDGARRLWLSSRAEPILVLDREPLARFPDRTAAITTGDLDGDGRTELVVLVGGEVQVLDEGGRLLARRSLRDLPAAPQPAREPFGTLCVRERRIDVAWAGAAAGISLRLERGALLPVGDASARPPEPTLGCGPDALRARLLPGVARLQIPSTAGVTQVWGGEMRGTMLLLLPDGTARAGPLGETRLADVGAGAALSERAGLSGGWTVAASTAEANPAEDRLRTWTGREWTQGVAVPGRILQVAETVLEGKPVLLLGVWTRPWGSELRVVRRAW